MASPKCKVIVALDVALAHAWLRELPGLSREAGYKKVIDYARAVERNPSLAGPITRKACRLWLRRYGRGKSRK